MTVYNLTLFLLHLHFVKGHSLVVICFFIQMFFLCHLPIGGSGHWTVNEVYWSKNHINLKCSSKQCPNLTTNNHKLLNLYTNVKRCLPLYVFTKISPTAKLAWLFFKVKLLIVPGTYFEWWYLNPPKITLPLLKKAKLE